MEHAQYRADGRWHGALTSRPLPDAASDPRLTSLTPAARAELAEHWLLRSASERRVADAFVVIRDDLRELAAEGPLLALAERAVDDEFRHAELCRVVASIYAECELSAPPLLDLVIPAHREAGTSLRRTLHIVGHCALNETFASSVLEAALAVTEGALAKAALRELLSDEIDHARIGWGHLSSLSTTERAAVAPWLPNMLRANLRMWRDASRLDPSEPVLLAHGALSRALVDQALSVALRDLIAPGLTQLGLATPVLLESMWDEVSATHS